MRRTGVQENSRWCSRVILLLVLVIFTAYPLSNMHASNTAESTEGGERLKKVLTECGPDTIQIVVKSISDRLFQPLFGIREADNTSIEAVCSMLKEIAEEGVVEPIPKGNIDTFFSGLDIITTSEYQLSLSFRDHKMLVSSEDGYLLMPSTGMFEKFKSLPFVESTLTLEAKNVQIGQTVRAVGVDVSFEEEEEIELLWSPEVESASSSDDLAFVVHRGKTQFGRFDLQFTMPAFGKKRDGSLQPIPPGKGTLFFVNLDAGGSGRELEVLPASTPLISINGLPASDPAMKALMIDGRVHVPIRAIAALTKQPVVWDAATKSVLIRTKPQAVEPRHADQVRLWIDGELAGAAYEPVLRDNVTYVPIRTLTAAFNLEVKWWPESRSVNIVIHGA
ncbi:hypothetical protein PA598K_00407 [Paenibacillus sp. 598K]|uniref:copper amine oxidase N-terminal domain-containing protein n=1 Tax=Paenibacillus sp. 598K TaxID=1117987 RepID=UPI000FFA5982|nr:copper amine oxidase N-terminal domain-containing protein [Paenibacillus sp. 598K]GBF72170.1 hypothetical protein PA598K_00407 [Paenibacillus sp. 598K]